MKNCIFIGAILQLRQLVTIETWYIQTIPIKFQFSHDVPLSVTSFAPTKVPNVKYELSESPLSVRKYTAVSAQVGSQ